MTRIKELASVLLLAVAPTSCFAFQTAAPRAAQDPNGARAPGIGTLPPAGTAVQRQPGQAQAQAPARFNDRLFTMVAADSGMAEVAAARMAAERAESDEVKQLAQQLVKDHTQTNQQLMAIAQTVQAPISRRLSPAKQAELAILASKTGAEFDRAFVDQQLATHLCAVALFQAEAQQGRNADLKQLASETLPTLQKHLQMVRRLPGSNPEK